MEDNPNTTEQHQNHFDITIIGAGITGSWLVRELSRFEGKIAILEKECQSGFGVTKGGLSQIHAPDFSPPGTLKAKFCANATGRFKKIAAELDLHFREVDELWLALEKSKIADLEAGKQRGEALEAREFSIIGPDKIRALEPHVTQKAVAALYVRGLGAIHPTEWTFGLIENARQNNAQAFFNTTVNGIASDEHGMYTLHTSSGPIQTKFIVNAAGLYADEIAKMAGDSDIKLILTKGTMAIMDKSVSHLTRHMVYGTFSEAHSQVVAPTAHGNLIAGLGYFTEPADKTDTKVERDKLEEVMKMGRELIPSLSEKDIITSFAGIKSENNKVDKGDFYIAHSNASPGFIHAIISSPGLTCAPAVAEMIINMLSDAGFDLKEKKDFQNQRVSWQKFAALSYSEKKELVTKNPQYGHVVCRCEKITAAEIQQSIQRGINTVDGVKHLTRAGMGRCQGGFCGPTVLDMLSRETGISPKAITKKGPGSGMLMENAGIRCSAEDMDKNESPQS